MKHNLLRVCVVFVAQLVLTVAVSAEVPLLLSYQGQIADSTGRPIDSVVAMTFTIYEDSLGATPLWTETHPDVAISRGLISVLLGDVAPLGAELFDGQMLWLGIQIGSGPPSDTLLPIIGSAYAIRSIHADTAQFAVTGAGGGGFWEVTDGVLSTVGFWGLARGSSANVMWPENEETHVNLGVVCTTGTSGASTSFCTVGGGYANSATGDLATVSGGEENVASGTSSTVSGGDENTASSAGSFVGGGLRNSADGPRAVVAGGHENSVVGQYSSIGGGYRDTIEANAATVAGGVRNRIRANRSAIGGGGYNEILAGHATIPGGFSNKIGPAGHYSYLFGINSELDEDSTFMVDMPHIRFGDTVDGYELPTVDGSGGQVMATDGSGQLDWVSVADLSLELPYSGFTTIDGGPAFRVTNHGTGAAVRGTQSSSDNIQSYGGYFEANGQRSRGILGLVTGTEGVGVSGVASDMGDVNNSGGKFEAYGQKGVGVVGTASSTGSGTNHGGYFLAGSIEGRGAAGHATGDYATGVYGSATGNWGKGVYGTAPNNGPVTNYGGYFTSAGQQGIGVYGEAVDSTGWINYGGYFTAPLRGVYGTASDEQGIGVFGEATDSGDVLNYGGRFVAHGSSGIGIYAQGGPNGYAAGFRGNVIVTTYETGETVVEIGEGLDYAEGFDVSDEDQISPGAVLIIDPDNPGKLSLSRAAYDRRVAGIVAGAGKLGSGVRLGASQFDYDVALAGRVYCNVDAADEAIQPGDLLTTSHRPGYAMKVTDYPLAQGAILGKAMERLGKGTRGQILVLVTLQ